VRRRLRLVAASLFVAMTLTPLSVVANARTGTSTHVGRTSLQTRGINIERALRSVGNPQAGWSLTADVPIAVQAPGGGAVLCATRAGLLGHQGQ
jgi:hypothetical protein